MVLCGRMVNVKKDKMYREKTYNPGKNYCGHCRAVPRNLPLGGGGGVGIDLPDFFYLILWGEGAPKKFQDIS